MLNQEIRFFDAQRAALCEAHEGRFALVLGSELVGVYDTELAAFEEGVSRTGVERSPFLVQEIVAEPQPIHLMPVSG